MRFLTFTDVHADMTLVKKLVLRAKKSDIDLVVTAGDYSVFGEKADEVLQQLNEIGKKVVIIPGNHESEASVKRAEKQYENIISIHKKTWEAQGVIFFGFGGGGFAQTDKEFRSFAEKWSKEITSKRSVFVTHGPPYNTKLDKLHGEYVGNKDYTDFVKKFQPTLYLCGHLHENAEKTDKIGRTICVNPGWEGKVLEIK